MKHLSLVLVIILSLGCEPDDICSESTQTTPRIVIEFFDIESLENNKTVPGLYAIGVDHSDSEITIYGEQVASRTKIELPLDGTQNQSRFKLYKNYDIVDGVTEGNPDVITIAYTTETIYVSRACGYKNTYNVQGISIENDSDLWIVNTEITSGNVINENNTHVKIYH